MSVFSVATQDLLSHWKNGLNQLKGFVLLKLFRIVCYKYSDCEGFICKYFYLVFVLVFLCVIKKVIDHRIIKYHKLEGISRNIWSNPHWEPGPFKFRYSQRWRTHNLPKQPDYPMVKTLLLISS